MNPLHSLQVQDGPQSRSSPRGPRASPGGAQQCQVHHCDRYRSEVSARRSRLHSDKTKRFWNSLGRGGEKKQAASFPVSALKIKLQIKSGTQYLQTSRGHTKSWGLKLECRAGPPPAPHQPAECKGPSPSLQAPAEGKDRRHSITPRGWRPSWAGACTDLRTIQSIALLYRWEN